MPEEEMQFHPDEQLMQPDEIELWPRSLCNWERGRSGFTGGEPWCGKMPETSSKDWLPYRKNFLTTNGFLADRYIDLFHASNIRSLNISIDSLSPEKIPGDNKTRQVRHSMEKHSDHGGTGLSCQAELAVVMEGVNDDELLDFVALTKDLPVHVRFIEFMPFGKPLEQQRRCSHGSRCWKDLRKIPVQEGRMNRMTRPEISGARSCRHLCGHQHHECPFCSTCNRMRLTADGKMKTACFLPEKRTC